MSQKVHPWHHCHACNAQPIVGLRYHCETCPTGHHNDLCQKCYTALKAKKITHPSEKHPNYTGPQHDHKFSICEGQPEDIVQPWLSIKDAYGIVPPIPDNFVVRPEFCAKKESFFGSYGFVTTVESQEKTLVLTALHVMDELIKKHNVDTTVRNTIYSGEELPKIIDQVKLYDVYANPWILADLGQAGPMLVLPNARTDDEEPYSLHDIAAFVLQNADKFHPLKVAETAPPVGRPIWIAISGKERCLRAVVVELTECSFVYRFDSSIKELPICSGAPVINQVGQVVGIVVGGGQIEGRFYGHANQAASIRQHLS